MINLELELIKSATFNRNCYIEVINNSELFQTHSLLVNILQELDEQKLNFDIPSIHARLKNYVDNAHADQLIIDLAKCTGSTTNYRDHLKQLSKIRNGEKIFDLATDITNAAKQKTMTVQEIQEHIQATIDNLHNYESFIDESISQYAARALDDIYNSSVMHKTGIDEIDEKIHGISNGQQIIIAARPSQGKTALGMQIAEHLALNNKNGVVLFFSLETKIRNLYARLLSRRARVESWKIQHHKLIDSERSRIIEAHEHYKNGNYNIIIFDGINDIKDIKKKIKKYKHITAIIVDYLQLITGGTGHTREQEVASISKEFKNIAQRLDIPVILLSQMSRAIEQSAREPQLSDLRESGAIEQDADVVIFIHADENQRHEKISESSFIIAKNRDGATGKVLTTFEKPYFTFGRIIDDGPSGTDWINN